MRRKIDIVIPLGSGSRYNNIELRFALRSIARYATGYRRVVVVGEDPGFLKESASLAFHPCPEASGNKEYRIAAKFLWAFQNVPLTSVVAMWNDDYILNGPVDVRTIRPAYKGLLSSSIAKHPQERYRSALQFTHDSLVSENLPVYHWDTHIPILYDGKFFKALLPWWEKSRQSSCGMVVKSVYQNNYLAKVLGGDLSSAELVKDCKVCSFRSGFLHRQRVAEGGRWMWSYSDDALGQGLLTWLQQKYNDYSDFEVRPKVRRWKVPV